MRMCGVTGVVSHLSVDHKCYGSCATLVPVVQCQQYRATYNCVRGGGARYRSARTTSAFAQRAQCHQKCILMVYFRSIVYRNVDLSCGPRDCTRTSAHQHSTDNGSTTCSNN
jgi:hypothetical protein